MPKFIFNQDSTIMPWLGKKIAHFLKKKNYKKIKNKLESIWSLYCYDTFLNNI